MLVAQIMNSHCISMTFSPKRFWTTLSGSAVEEPSFSSYCFLLLPLQSLLKRSNGKGPTRGIDGFVVELNTAGGNNAASIENKSTAVHTIEMAIHL